MHFILNHGVSTWHELLFSCLLFVIIRVCCLKLRCYNTCTVWWKQIRNIQLCWNHTFLRVVVFMENEAFTACQKYALVLASPPKRKLWRPLFPSTGLSLALMSVWCETQPCLTAESSGDSLLHFRWSAYDGMSKHVVSSSSSEAQRWQNVPLCLWAALFACFSTLVECSVRFCGRRSVLCCFIVGLESWGKISH